MLLFVLAYLGGVLTIVSPCILPVIPFVLARADRPFLRNGLPMLVGMALAFAVVATPRVGRRRLGGLGQSIWPHRRLGAAGDFRRDAAVSRARRPPDAAAGRGRRPAVAVGGSAADGSIWAPLLLGVATGFLWAPCAGPVLGLILTGAALAGRQRHRPRCCC